MEWISVKDRLPGKHARYLVWARNALDPATFEPHISWFFPSHPDCWGREVSHWCEIVPPKE